MHIMSIKTMKCEEKFTERALACKRIRVDETNVKSTVAKIMKAINYFNSLKEHDAVAFETSMPLNQIKVLNEFSCLVKPASVRLDPNDRRTNNLLTLENSVMPFGYNEYLDACITWRGYFKKDISDNIITLDTLRIHKSLMDTLSNVALPSEGEPAVYKVRYDGSPFIPIYLNDLALGLFRKDYFNASDDDVIDDYFATLTF